MASNVFCTFCIASRMRGGGLAAEGLGSQVPCAWTGEGGAWFPTLGVGFGFTDFSSILAAFTRVTVLSGLAAANTGGAVAAGLGKLLSETEPGSRTGTVGVVRGAR